MAKKPALTKAQLETLRRKLEDERKRVVRVLESAAAPDQDEAPIEIEEAAQRETDEEHETDVAEKERALLAEIDRALGKMNAGTYGISETTGAPISYARLKAVPWARQGADEEEEQQPR
ncbi:MAG TPA: TraR/DksA family transcriptional regulator [Myxococcales bacterium]|nr:TraR/DksA family transcriptional regulator [Myxococcales bacterium]